MKNKFVFTLMIWACLICTVNAKITSEEAISPEYLINYGYSENAAESVFLLKNRVNGKPIEPLYDKNSNRIIKAIKNFYSYIDPAIDSEDRYHHDIHNSPSFKDL